MVVTGNRTEQRHMRIFNDGQLQHDLSNKMIEAIEVIKRMRFTDVSNEKSQMPETDIVAFETTC